MIDIIFFDTDCISAFLWVRDESILEKMYSGKIVIPQKVYDEMSNPKVSWMKDRVDKLIVSGAARIEGMDIESEEYELYISLTTVTSGTGKVIGKGEAASISLAKKYNGTVASNNLKDIMEYIEEFSLAHITTGDILVEAYNRGIIDENQGNAIWANMIAKRRKLGADSFTEYLRK